MNRKRVWIPCIAVLLFILCFLYSRPVYASDEGAIPVSYSFPTISGGTVTENDFQSDLQLVVFLRSTMMEDNRGKCSNSTNIASELHAASWAHTEGLRIILVDANGQDANMVASFKERYAPDNTDFVFAYNGNNTMWNYYWTWTDYASNSLMFPVCALIKDGYLLDLWTGDPFADTCFDHVSAHLEMNHDNPSDNITVQYEVQFGQSEARGMLDDVNAFRTGGDAWAWNWDDSEKVWYDGLSPLNYDYGLEAEAMRRAYEIGLLYSHDGPDGLSWFRRSVHSYGENIAFGYTSANSVYMAWREDEDPYDGQGHRRNMLGREYDAIGIGHAIVNGYHCWVQEFGYSTGVAATAANDSAAIVETELSPDYVRGYELDVDTSNLVLPYNGSLPLPAAETDLWCSAYTTTWVKPTNAEISWTCSDNTRAQIVGNTLQGLKAGHVTLTVTSTLGPLSDTKTIEVDVVVPVTGVSLNKTSATTYTGGSFQLTPNVKPSNATNKEVQWSSSNNYVATVDASGKVKGVNPGTATITVTTVDGAKKASCTVTVKPVVSSVSLDKTALTLKAGASEKLTATVKPDDAYDKSITWSSSNTAVATVDKNGTVKAVKAGTATITVKTNDQGKTATCKVTVKPLVTGVSLNKTSLTLTVGTSEKLTAAVKPDGAYDKTVVWSSSDTSVATVDNNGTVKAGKVGTATITVKTNDQGKTATCKVTVSPATVRVTGVKLDKSSIVLAPGKSQTLKATVSPSNATNKAVAWVFANAGAATVDGNGKVTAGKKPGTATIMVKSADGGKTATCKVTVGFTDVLDSTKYFYKPVYWAAEKGITNGYDDGSFGHALNCTRAHVVTFLWRMAGKPEPKTKKNPFNDIKSSDYYYKAVLWAAEKGITNGYSSGPHAGGFGPDETCLREHVVTFLWRYAGKPKPRTTKNPFNDIKSNKYYYNAAVWANEKGIAKGYTSGAHKGGFGPELDCLREHVVTFLYRYSVNG